MMRRASSGWIAGAVAVGLLTAELCHGGGAAAAAVAGPRVVIVGFDGAGFQLARQFIDEGKMPCCAKLEKSGTFAPLGSSNPAESPVAWASINTGQNPGKTNIFGFIRRTFVYGDDRGKPGRIQPTIGYNRDSEADLPGGSGKMPVVLNDLRCDNFWDLLDRAGLESRVLQAACNFPAKGGAHTYLLSGLSTPDARGTPGTFLLFTNGYFDWPRQTNDGGEVEKFKVVCPSCKSKTFSLEKGCTKCKYVEKVGDEEHIVGFFETRLKGPANFVAARQWKERIDGLQKSYDAATGTDEASIQKKADLQKQLQKTKNERETWKKEHENATVPLSGWIDRKARTIKFDLGGRQFTVKEGQWSDYIPIVFDVEGAFAVKASAHLHVSQCNDVGKDAEEVRFYLPAITVAADDPPPNMPITAPREFGKELVGAAGLFDTIGWACQTHALKDAELSEASFLSAIWDTIQWRRKMLLAELAKPTWSTLFQVFGETDRVSHMMYRYFDPKHPFYKEEEAAKTCRFGEREIAFKDAIPAVYEEVDRTIGLVADQIEKGALGDCTLMVCSDHGFSPFREEVELNAWLIDQGFMTVRKDESGAPSTSSDYRDYVDWSQTKAYSMGIGTIYLNLKGREPAGIVDPADYDKVCDAIIAKMLAYRNPNASSPNDPQVFKGAWKRSEYLAGPFAGDIRDADGRCTEGTADIQVGFNFGYRVGWGTALGGRSKSAVVFNNKSPWSGDHTSVHPYLVRGIFLSSRKMAADGAPQLQDLAPTALALLGQKVPDDMDGHVIPLAGLEAAAKSHAGGKANRESLVPPK